MRRLVYLSDAYPVLSQTFTVREVRGLHAAGVPMRVISLRPPGPRAPAVDPELDPPVELAPSPFSAPVLGAALRRGLLQPLRWWPAALRSLLPHTLPFQARLQLRAPLHVSWGAWLAEQLADEGPVHLHAQFTWGACTAAWTAARLLGAPFSFTSHSDHGLPLIRPKLRAASRVFVISEHDRRRLHALAPELPEELFRVLRVGVELPPEPSSLARAEGPARLLAVGTLGPVKGHDLLLRAAAGLIERGLDFRLQLVGDGPERERLRALHAELDLGERVELLGARAHEEVLRLTDEADVVALACRVTADGDHDGIPVALMEGMARGKPVVSTRLSGIPELVGDDKGGLLVEPEDVPALTEALARLVEDASLRAELGAAARRRVARLHEASTQERETVEAFTELLNDEGPAA